MNSIRSLLFACLVMTSVQALGTNIIVLGLFKDKVVLKINNQRMVLKTGEIAPDGTKVISVTHKEAVLEINGRQEAFGLGTEISNAYKPPQQTVVRIPKDAQGMYRTDGKINTYQVKFLVDTGATLVALNSQIAKQMNIPFEDAPKTQVETASGRADAYQITIDSVSVGGIIVRDVPAVVVNSNAPKEILLGMSFLKHTNMKNDNNLMLLQQKY